MTEAQSAEPLRLLQQEIVLAGEAVETLKRDQRAAIDALRLEVEVLKRCLCQVHPELDVHFISSLPVMQRSACKAWADKRHVQIVWAVR
jgi:hypothetical protein